MRSPPGDVTAGHDHQITTTQMSLFFNVTGSIVQCPHEGTAPSSHLEPPPPVREPNRGSGTPVVLGRPRASWDHGRPRTAQRYWNPDRFWDAGGTGTPPVLERGNGTGTRNWSWNAGVVLERPRCWNAGTLLERETGPGITRGGSGTPTVLERAPPSPAQQHRPVLPVTLGVRYISSVSKTWADTQ